jgi:hypothetical protein
MLQHIIDSSKDELSGQFQQRGLSAIQSKDALGMVKKIIQDKLTSRLSDSDGLINLLRSRQTLTASTLVKNMTTDFASKMSIKFGCNAVMAKGAADYAVPLLIGKVSSHVSATGLKAANLSRLLHGGSIYQLKSFSKGILGKFF